MLKHQLYLKIFFLVATCWLIFSFLFGRFKSIADGYNEVGFPFVFYRSFSGKCFDCKDIGFLWKEFFLDIAVVFAIAFILKIVISNRVGR